MKTTDKGTILKEKRGVANGWKNVALTLQKRGGYFRVGFTGEADSVFTEYEKALKEYEYLARFYDNPKEVKDIKH